MSQVESWKEWYRRLRRHGLSKPFKIDPKSRDGRNYRVHLRRPDGSALIVMIPTEDDYSDLEHPEGYYLNFVTGDHYTTLDSKILRFSDLRDLTSHERKDRIREFSQRPSHNNGSTEIDQGIAEFESRYEMSSKTMREQFRTGNLRETAEIGRWLILLALGTNNEP